MNLKTIQLEAGKLQEIGFGRFVRMFSASAGEPVEVQTRTTTGEGDLIFDLIENVGVECYPFNSALITSKVDQVIQIAWSPLSIDDNRLGVGNNTLLRVDGNVRAQGLDALVSTLPGELLSLPQNVQRKSVTLNASAQNLGVLWVGGNAVDKGVPLEADDTITLEIKEALDIFATDSGDKLYAIEVI